MTDELHQGQHAQRGGGRGLKDNAVARSQSGGQLPSCHQEGEVPGHNLPHHADGLMEDDVHKVAHMVLQDAGGSLLGADGAGKIPEVIGGIGHVNGHGLPNGLAVVHGLDGGQQFLVLVDHIRDFQQDIGALVRLQVSPSGEGSPGGLNSGIHILLGGLGTLGQLLPCGGVGGGENPAVGGGNPRSVDVKIISFVQLDVHTRCSFLFLQNRDQILLLLHYLIVLGRFLPDSVIAQSPGFGKHRKLMG